jgi:Cof subfamily protein (haloacid dehalogenase superfamily)
MQGTRRDDHHGTGPGPSDTVRLLGLDVDGTLLTTVETLTPRTRAALEAAGGLGWHVALVTGRPLAIALPVARDLGVGQFIAAANGATVAEVETGAVLYQASLSGPVAVEAITAARRAVPGLGLAVTTPRGFFREPGFSLLAPLVDAEGTVVTDACPRPDEVVHSLVLFVAEGDALELQVTLAPLLPPAVSVSPSGLPGSVELTAPGVHKGSGLAHLCDRLGVAQRDVVAFGDGLNDHEMLVWAGFGVAMGNSDPATKEVADEVTGTNDEDGVATVVERLLAGLARPR